MIHKFSINGVNVIMDIHSGAVHVVDNIVYNIVDKYIDMDYDEIVEEYTSVYGKKGVEEALEEIKQLKDNGMLFTDDIYENVIPLVNSRNPVVKALCLHVAHDCNLKCKYCFAQEGEYHGKRSLMSAEVGKAAIDFIIKNSGNRKNLEVDFFGGEPLMNLDVVKEIVNYGRQEEKKYNKNFRFTITTNGILLNDDMQKFINENMHNLVLSIDGRKEVNDKMRPKAGGQGSYEEIVPKFKKIAESRNQDNYYVRGTYTRHNMDFCNDVLHLADLGFKQISVEPVVADENEEYALKEKDLDILFKEYEKLAEEIYIRRKNGNDFNFFHFNIDLKGGPCVAKRLSGCGSGTEYLAVAPEGDFYPCHQFVGIDEFRMGNVFEGVTNFEKRLQFEKCNVYSKPECKKCWAKFYCSGGCASNAYQYGGSIFSTYKLGCELQKKRIECAIMIKAKEFAEI